MNSGPLLALEAWHLLLASSTLSKLGAEIFISHMLTKPLGNLRKPWIQAPNCVVGMGVWMARPAPGQLSQHLPSTLGLWVPVSPASPTGPDLGWNPQAIHTPPDAHQGAGLPVVSKTVLRTQHE